MAAAVPSRAGRSQGDHVDGHDAHDGREARAAAAAWTRQAQRRTAHMAKPAGVTHRPERQELVVGARPAACGTEHLRGTVPWTGRTR